MVSRPRGTVITALREATIELWTDPDLSENRYKFDYFWLHRMFSHLMMRRYDDIGCNNLATLIGI